MEPLFRSRMKWVSEPDEGIYDAMNKGILMATGDVVGFLNGDDYYQDNRVLEDIARAFSENGTDAVHGNLSYINSERKVVRTWQGSPYRPGAFQRGWNPAHPTFYCTRECFERYGLFDPSIGSAADFRARPGLWKNTIFPRTTWTVSWCSCAREAPARQASRQFVAIPGRTSRHSGKTAFPAPGITESPVWLPKSFPSSTLSLPGQIPEKILIPQPLLHPENFMSMPFFQC